LILALAAIVVHPAAAATVATQFHHGPDHLGVFDGPSPGNLLKTVWTAELGSYTVASPVVADGVLYIGGKSGALAALDAKTGARLWTFQADGPVSATVAVADAMVFFQSAQNTVFAVDAKTGRQVWRHATGPTLAFYSGPPGFPEGVNWDFWTSSPLYDNGVVFIGSGDGQVYALDARTGVQRLAFATGQRVRATPASDGKTIYVGGFDGNFYALDARSGRERWRFKTEGNAYFPVGSIQSSAALAGSLVLFGSRDFNLYALDARTGRKVWGNLHKESWATATPAVLDGRVYEGSSDGHFERAVDLKTGTEIWTRPTDSNVYSSAAINGGALYVGTFGGTIARARLSDGKGGGLIFQERIYASPWIEDGIAYFATADGTIYALSNGDLPK